jgi:hypothetical protein
MLACVIANSSAIARYHHRHFSAAPSDASGNVVSHKTGATARVSSAHAGQFQAYVDDIEARGGIVRFMGGIRRGHCSSSSMHPCGRALDVCQTGRGRVDARCHLPSRHELAHIAAAHGLFEGGQWCHSDYGHAQVGVSAAACGQHRDAPTTMVASARSHHRWQVAAAQSFATPDRLTVH